MNKKEFLLNEIQKLNINLSDHQVNQFISFYELLLEWNSFMNLTAITDYENVVKKHFVDSLSISRILKFDQNMSLIDVGTGAGFPGIPLKIVYPELNITLLDSLNKRISFLKETINYLQLTNITTLHGRAEEYAKKDKLGDSFDICVSRAVANLSSLTELCLPFVKQGGKFISYKSEKLSVELDNAMNSITLMGGKIHSIDDFYICNNELYRSFITIIKVGKTPKGYPRKPGMALKSPII